MTDIVERLELEGGALLSEAAAEIERLRAEVLRLNPWETVPGNLSPQCRARQQPCGSPSSCKDGRPWCQQAEARLAREIASA